MKFPLLGILGLIFVTLKLTDNIDWSWWWVLLPFWGPLAIAVLFLLVAGAILGFDKIKVSKKGL